MGAKVQIALASAVLVACVALLTLHNRGAADEPNDADPHGGGAAGELLSAAADEPDRVDLVAHEAAEERAREAVAPPAAAPKAPQTILVRVIDPDGAGVAGATVAISRWSSDWPVFATATTDADGRAVLTPESGPLARCRVGYRAQGYVGGDRDCTALEEQIEVRMRWSASIAGVVRDAVSRRLLAGATVEAGDSSTTSDADGRYQLDGLPLDVWLPVHARCPGFVLRGAGALLPERGVHPLDLALEHASPLLVQVVDRETREPIAGVELAERERSPVIARTDAAGIAEVDTLVGAELTLVANAPDHESLCWTWDVEDPPAAGERFAATLPLARTGWVVGTVLGAGGSPLADAFVYCACEKHRGTIPLSAEVRDEFDLPGTCEDQSRARSPSTDTDGAFRIPVPCGDPVTLTAIHEGHPSCSLGPLAPPSPGGTIRADLRMVASGGVRGLVTRNGDPWAGAIVAAVGTDCPVDRTDDDGRYALEDLPAGPVKLELRTWVRGAPLRAVDILVEPGAVVESDLAWVRETAWIRGRVVAPEGSPRLHAKVWAFALDHDDAWHASTETAADGAFSLDVAAGAMYRLYACDERAGSCEMDGVSAGAKGVELVLPWSGTLRLRLIDAATGELATITPRYAWTGAWRPSGEAAFRSIDAEVDVYGQLAAELEAGTVDVMLHFPADGYAPVTLHGVAVPASGETEPIVVRLERGVDARLRLEAPADARDSLKGHVVFLLEDGQLGAVEGPIPDDAPGPNARIHNVRMRLADPLLDTGEVGVQVFRGLAPGRYHVCAFPADLMFEPASIDLPAVNGEPIPVRWRAP